MARFIGLLFALAMISSCTSTGEKKGGSTVEDPPIEVKTDSAIIMEKANGVVKILKENSLLRLMPYIHPEKGVRFSPYATVDTGDAVVFRNDISSLSSKEVRNWGVYDGSGEAMDLTFDEYHKKFIYDYDFADADSVFYNTPKQHGNSINNIGEMYPGARTVEYYISGEEGEYKGFEWRALRLVFEKLGKEWFLIGIVHSEWTI